MLRVTFRILIAITLVMMFIERRMGERMRQGVVQTFDYWFLISVFVFGVFGVIAAWRAWREPQNRRAYLFDVMLAAAWVPYWFANVGVNRS